MRPARVLPGAGVGALLLALVLSACAGIPSSGRVQSASVPDDGTAGAPRYAPAGPRAGSSPEQIVRGYLDAMLAYPVSTGTAARFLSPDARRSWQSRDLTTVYSAQTLSFVPMRSADNGPSDDGSVVDLQATRQARLDAQGRYEPGEVDFTKRFRLTKVKGEWRIVNPPTGTLVTSKFFEDYYRPYSLWFFDRPGRRLVPEVVHLVAGERLATSLATSLSAGPEDDSALRTFLRAGDGLRPSVPVSDDGLADVELAGDVASRSEGDRERVLAQLVRTLRQVPDVRSVRVTAGTTILTPGEPGSSGLATRYDPPGSGPRVYAVVRSRLREVTTDGLSSVAGTWGTSTKGFSRVAVGDAGVAGLLSNGSGVRVTDRQGREPRTVAAAGVVALTWDSSGVLWIVDRPSGRTRVRVVRGDDVTTVPSGSLAGLDVTSFAVSPDGGHFAVTDGSDGVRVGSVRRGTSEDTVVRLLPAHRVVRSADRPSDVRWFDGTHVGFLASTTVGDQVHAAAIDGSDRSGGLTGAEPLLPDVGAAQLAIGPGAQPPVWTVDARKRLWYRPVGQSWLVADKGPVSSLSTAP